MVSSGESTMSRIAALPSPTWTLSRLRRHFGMIPAERILRDPPPGKATERDVARMRDHTPTRKLCELVDGVLVEKAMGTKEGYYAGVLLHLIWSFLDKHSLGIVLGADGMLRLLPGLVRIPDVSFISWERLGGDELPDDAIASLVPDLAVEVVSKGNTKEEIDRKLTEYFETGVRLAWVVYPKTRTVKVYTAVDEVRTHRESESLDGGEVLPGFKLPLAKLFAPPRRRR